MTDWLSQQERSSGLEEAWGHFVDSTESLRHELHRYCRRMTRSVWDAEDLVQETVLRCFGSMSAAGGEIRNPRGFMFRTATNL